MVVGLHRPNCLGGMVEMKKRRNAPLKKEAIATDT
jgi:hypothetical protein